MTCAFSFISLGRPTTTRSGPRESVLIAFFASGAGPLVWNVSCMHSKFTRALSLVFVAQLLSGCSIGSTAVTFKNRSGDLVQFIDQELRKYGATPPANQQKPIMQAEWQYAEDKDGFQILIGQDRKTALVQALTASLGQPLLREKYPHLVYKEDRFGVGLVADLNNNPIHIICIKKGVL